MNENELKTLEGLLAVEGTEVECTQLGQHLECFWRGEIKDPRLVDMPDGCLAYAKVRIFRGKPAGAEWEIFIVEPEARHRGIFTAAMSLEKNFLRKAGLWPAYVHAAANEADFYRSAGFRDIDTPPGYMVKDHDQAQAWLGR
jgi:GNAT superfamily N-acetyltransferase